MTDALYSAKVETESCIAFLDIQGFLPISKAYAQLLREHPDDIRSRLWQKLNNIIRECLPKYHPTAIREVGGDAWLLTFPNADDAVGWALDTVRSVKNEFMLIIIGISWGIPRLTKGGATDQSSIIAFKIVEGAGKALGNQILVTEKVVEQLKDQSIRRHCKFVGNCKMRFLGQVCLYRVEDM